MSEQFTFFWGEEPFSQWSRIGFEIDGIHYNCAEQWMMACKARFFSDPDTLKEIMAATHPAEQKRLGRQVKNFVTSEWEKVAREYVYQGNMAKFRQNAKAKKQLFETKGTTIVEASPKDKIWGIGLDARTARATDRSQWQGLNWLGEVLMRVRKDLLAESGTTD
jgi:ribA/ribD-fused uncharacterized protein